MKRICILLIFSVLFMQLKSIAQGCVAIKGTAGICSRPTDAKGWEMNINNRYFKSYKHFVGTVEQKQSNSDKRRSADTDSHVQGDAAFADYLISAGLTFKL